MYWNLTRCDIVQNSKFSYILYCYPLCTAIYFEDFDSPLLLSILIPNYYEFLVIVIVRYFGSGSFFDISEVTWATIGLLKCFYKKLKYSVEEVTFANIYTLQVRLGQNTCNFSENK